MVPSIGMFSKKALPIGCQVVPLVEREAVELAAASRSNLTQCGAVMPASLVLKLVISVPVRPWKAIFDKLTKYEPHQIHRDWQMVTYTKRPIAFFGERLKRLGEHESRQPWISVLIRGIFCTFWPKSLSKQKRDHQFLLVHFAHKS